MSYNHEVSDLPAPELVLRVARADDPGGRSDVTRLAALDSAAVPPGPYVIASLGDRAIAARSLSTGATVADPFTRTADVLPMLELRADQLQRASLVARPGRLWRRIGVRAT